MPILTADFERGTNTATIASTDAGSNTPWNTVTVGGTGAIIYDTAHTYGSLAGKYSTGGTANANTTEWTSGTVGTITDHYMRIYIYLTANPGGQFTYCRIRSTTTLACRYQISATGKFTLFDSSAIQATSTNSIATNQWVRVELHTVHDATVGSMQLLYYANADSTTITETLTATNINTLASANNLQFGQPAITAGTTNCDIWLDNIYAGATAYPGPVILSQGTYMAKQAVNRASTY